MRFMWYLEKSESGTIAKAVVFEEEALEDFLAEGWQITAKYQIQLLEGESFLPEAIEQ